MVFQELKIQVDVNMEPNESETSPRVSFDPMYVRGRKKPLEQDVMTTPSPLEQVAPEVSLRATTLQPPETRAQPTARKPC